MELKVVQVGNSLGVVLPKELTLKLGVQKGDTLIVTDGPGGVYLEVPSADFDAQMAVARQLMHKWRNVLRELAK